MTRLNEFALLDIAMSRHYIVPPRLELWKQNKHSSLFSFIDTMINQLIEKIFRELIDIMK